MTFDPNDVLRRFHRALVREIQASNPELLSSPFSVAEIYQNLVPYRTHRDEIGVEMNADYEHALLRLLAGEHDYLTIESRTARQEIREELESPNPNTSLYRDFAAADVRLNPDKIDEALMWDRTQADEGQEEVPIGDTGPEAGEEVVEIGEVRDLAVGWGGDASFEEEAEVEVIEEVVLVEEETGDDALDQDVVTHLVAEVEPKEVLVKDSKADTTLPSGGNEEPDEESLSTLPDEGGDSHAPKACAWCREALPDRPGVNFCPFCGCSVHLVPCPECGEELELNWRFCIACGTEVSS